MRCTDPHDDSPSWGRLARNSTAGQPLTARAIAYLGEKCLGTVKRTPCATRSRGPWRARRRR
jgi:hypothetical protein